MGSFVALPFAWYLWLLPQAWMSWGIFCAVFVIGVWAAEDIAQRSGVQDNQCIVIDEALGIFLTASVAAHQWLDYLLVFLLFRLFDIWKPGPVRWIDQHIKGGLGVIVDDIAAALLALLSLVLLHKLLPQFFLS